MKLEDLSLRLLLDLHLLHFHSNLNLSRLPL
nr:hypothetical protein Q903MT_gene1971 [Picea sitchensis]